MLIDKNRSCLTPLHIKYGRSMTSQMEETIQKNLNHINIAQFAPVRQFGLPIVGSRRLAHTTLTPPFDDIFHQMASAISYLHAKRISHRQPTPHHWQVVGRQIQLDDFSCAIYFSAEKIEHRFTTQSDDYLSPELLLGKLCAGSEIDIWVLGVVFYQLLSGQHPFGVMHDKTHEIIFRQPDWSLVANFEHFTLLTRMLHRHSWKRPTANIIQQILTNAASVERNSSADTTILPRVWQVGPLIEIDGY